MAALATASDVEAQLGRSLTSDEEERIDSLLSLASSVARRATGRQFEAGSYTVTRRPRRGRVVLPETPATVDEVRGVYSDGSTEVIDEDGYTLRGSTIYGLSYWCEVEIDYTTDASAPDEIVQAVAAIAARGVGSITRDPAVESETIGAYSVRYKDGAVGALPYELSLFATYAAPRFGPIHIL